MFDKELNFTPYVVIRYFPLNKKLESGRLYLPEYFKHLIGCEYYGGIGHTPIDSQLNVDVASHKTTILNVNDEHVVLKCTLLSTKSGHMAKLRIKELTLSPQACGSPQEDGSINDYRLIRFDLIDDPRF